MSDQHGRELDADSAARAFGQGYFNLIRRGADGSLTLSADHWRLEQLNERSFVFVAREPQATRLEVALNDVGRLAWDRLPRQRVRSQIRFQLTNGDVWTFSGSIDESALPR